MAELFYLKKYNQIGDHNFEQNMEEEDKNLKILFADGICLTKINLINFNNLTTLDISENNLTRIDTLPINLLELSCEGNNVEFICDHEKLESLDCNKNNLERLGKYPKLKTLYCSDNKIETIDFYENLQKIVCCNNKNIKIDERNNLIFLNCSNTNITKINFINLEELDISNNKKLTNNDIKFLSKIKYLDITNTPITHIDFYDTLNCLLINIGNDNIFLDEKYKNKKFNVSTYKESFVISFV